MLKVRSADAHESANELYNLEREMNCTNRPNKSAFCDFVICDINVFYEESMNVCLKYV